MTEHEKGYFIREFSWMTGLPQSKIRYYERLGLFKVPRMKNGYRWFIPEDAFRVNAFRTLLQYGFSIEQAVELLDEPQKTPEFEAALTARRQALTREKQLLESRIQALDASLALLNQAAAPDFSVQELPDKLFVCASQGRNFRVASQSMETITRFVKLLPVSHYGRLLDAAQFEAGEPLLLPNYVSVIDASDEALLGDYDRSQVQRLPLGRCLVWHRQLTRAESVRRESFAPLLDWLEAHGCRMGGQLLILPAFFNLDGAGTDVETVIVPLE